MTTFEWMNPQTTGILFLWAPVGAKKLGVRFKSRSAVGVSFSTSNTLHMCVNVNAMLLSYFPFIFVCSVEERVNRKKLMRFKI